MSSPSFPIDQDMRSSSRTQKRERKQSAKYYGYRGVKPSWVGQPYLALRDEPCHMSNWHQFIFASGAPVYIAPQSALKTLVWTKLDMYKESSFNIWPLDARHSRGRRCRGCDYRPSTQLNTGKKMRDFIDLPHWESIEEARGDWDTSWEHMEDDDEDDDEWEEDQDGQAPPPSMTLSSEWPRLSKQGGSSESFEVSSEPDYDMVSVASEPEDWEEDTWADSED